MISMLGFRVMSPIMTGLAYTPFSEVLQQGVIESLDITPEEAPVISRLAQTGVILQRIVDAYRRNNNDEAATRAELQEHRRSHFF